MTDGQDRAGGAGAPAGTGADGSDAPLTDHEYDGIREYDNPLPGWWNQLFWATIIFSVLYLGYYHSGVEGRSVAGEFQADDESLAALRSRLALSTGTVTTEVIAAIRADRRHLDEGKRVFAMNCASCHGPEGGGGIGPNLTDGYWLHGKGRLLDIYATVTKGVPAKGMIAWENSLKPEELLQVVGYVSTLRGTTPAAPAAPQGEKVDGVTD